MKIDNATALVTGANRGIGRALVEALLDGGAGKIYAAARNPDTLAGVTALDRKRVVPLKADVTGRAAIAALPNVAPDATLLLNNAGVLDVGSVLDTPIETIDRQFATNFYGQLLTARAFAPVIERNRGGAIANVLTVVAFASMPGIAAYNAAKAAAWSMTQSLRASLAPRGIDVHAVFPGPVDTDMAAGFPLVKTAARDVAGAIVAGINAGEEDILPDPMSAQTYSLWKSDHKAVERRFAAM